MVHLFKKHLNGLLHYHLRLCDESWVDCSDLCFQGRGARHDHLSEQMCELLTFSLLFLLALCYAVFPFCISAVLSPSLAIKSANEGRSNVLYGNKGSTIMMVIEVVRRIVTRDVPMVLPLNRHTLFFTSNLKVLIQNHHVDKMRLLIWNV